MLSVHAVAAVTPAASRRFILDFVDIDPLRVWTRSSGIRLLLRDFVRYQPRAFRHLYVAVVGELIVGASARWKADDPYMERLFRLYGQPAAGILPFDARPVRFSPPPAVHPSLREPDADHG